MSDKKQIIIIGAGIGGLTSAIRLAAQGHAVHLLERQTQVGGKLNQIEMDGFHFDTGPSLITMPYVFRELFQSVGRRLEDYLDLQPLELTCRYFYRDGNIVNAWRDHERTAAEFARLNPHDGEAFRRFIAFSRTIFEAAADPFLYNSLGSPLTVLEKFIQFVWHGHGADQVNQADVAGIENGMQGIRARLRAVFAALSPATLDDCVRGFFEDEHLRQLFDRYATYNGSSPYQIGAVYSIIPYVEIADGGWYPCGGIYAVARALERLARELGVRITTSCNVERILIEHAVTRGVVLADRTVLRCDLVVANSDVVTTHRELIAPSARSARNVQRLSRLEPSCSGFVLLLGTNKLYPQLAHHNIFFSDDYRAEFVDLFEKKIPQHNPTIYICATTRTDVSQAPAGHENLFVLVNAPYLTSQSDWQRDSFAYRERILDLLTHYPQIDLSDLREHIVCEQMITPQDFQQRYGANAGSIYGLSSNQRMAPFTRPGNRARGIKNLYFVGGSTHPGGGVPMVMLSGRIVANLIEEDISAH